MLTCYGFYVIMNITHGRLRWGVYGMEETLRQLLEGQKQLVVGQQRVELRLDKMDKRFDKIDGRLDKMDERFDKIDGRLDKMDERFDRIEIQQGENTEFIKALLHHSEHQKAQMDQLLHVTARIEGEIKSIRTDLGAVEAITAKNWNDIIQLRVAK